MIEYLVKHPEPGNVLIKWGFVALAAGITYNVLTQPTSRSTLPRRQ